MAREDVEFSWTKMFPAGLSAGLRLPLVSEFREQRNCPAVFDIVREQAALGNRPESVCIFVK